MEGQTSVPIRPAQRGSLKQPEMNQAPDPEVFERFLRPKAVAEAGQNNAAWGESEALWIPDEREGYLLARRLKDRPSEAELECTGGVVRLPEVGVEKSNSSRNERAEDMAGMAELNEATVLHNLRRRYQSNLIYTYSGLFLVALNPWKRLPIYDEGVRQLYNKESTSMPPHIFATADAAYRAMLAGKQNQSILITGESGAGKTENTKRVVQYLAGVGSGQSGLEARLIQANPILEAFGNAQTVRNDNSSRFGKFIKIDFDAAGTLTGATIERYLLEKSRVTCRSPQERTFHIFYQFLRGASKEMKERLGVGAEANVEDFVVTRGSRHTVDGIDDAAEFQVTTDAMETLGFDPVEKESFLKGIAIILLLGNIELCPDEHGQAQFKEPKQMAHLCQHLGVPAEEFGPALLNPVMRAGGELVAQGRDVQQVQASLEALARSIYERLFTRLVARINASLAKSSGTLASTWIGVLDIAGFEIFEKNSFEQLCVNYTNEKLQQFFNHHMFTREQEEYQRERVDWTPVDFGLDLQPTIDLIERTSSLPGLLACLDEDCVVPKATDRSYCEKLCALWKGKSGAFETGRFGDVFSIKHYAGKVEYGTEGWLEKNKDPLNENVVRVLMASACPMLSSLFIEEESTSRLVKRGQFRTVAQRYRESLGLLMQQLGGTQPHFVRCIIPNGRKAPGELDAQLVLEQLRCNGVLEGIRICRMGFPTRLPYAQFARLYEILGQAVDPDSKAATRQLLQQLAVPADAYRLGQTKVFFKAGELTKLDAMRDAKLSTILASFQAMCRGALARQAKTRLLRQQEAAVVLQASMKKLVELRQWSWWKLYMRVKPLLNVSRAENRIEELEDEVSRLEEEKESQTRALRSELDAERDKLMALESAKRDYERQLQQAELLLQSNEEHKADLAERIRALEADLGLARSLKMASEQAAESIKVASDEKICAMRVEHEEASVELRSQLAALKDQIEGLDFERAKLERSETSLRGRLSELESALEDARQSKRDLEAKLKQSEEARRQLEQTLQDDSVSNEKLAEMQSIHEAQLQSLRKRQEEDQQRTAEEMDALRKRFQREILALTGDLEAERKSLAAARDAVRQYESGNDSLTSELEAERRAQEAWRRDRERLEARVRELSKANAEIAEREDSLQASLFAANDAARDLRQRIGALEDEALILERCKMQAEAKAERLNESMQALQSELAVSTQRAGQLEARLAEANSRLSEEQDESAVLKERLRAAEHLGKLHQARAEESLRHLEAAREDAKRFEAQVKDLQMRLLESTSSFEDSSSLRLSPPTLATLTQLREQMESETELRLTLFRESRSKDRTIASLHALQSTWEQERITLEEAIAKSEIRQRKLQSRVDQLETGLSEAEFGRRRAERQGEEGRAEVERLQREIERLKARIATANC